MHRINGAVVAATTPQADRLMDHTSRDDRPYWPDARSGQLSATACGVAFAGASKRGGDRMTATEVVTPRTDKAQGTSAPDGCSRQRSASPASGWPRPSAACSHRT
jgi:hypothetical protein